MCSKSKEYITHTMKPLIPDFGAQNNGPCPKGLKLEFMDTHHLQAFHQTWKGLFVIHT
jgi:hypothetical protein